MRDLDKENYDELTNNSIYVSLIDLEKPFFKLKHGKLYDCTVQDEKGFEETSIIPLAFEKGKNRQYIMYDARRLFKVSPNFVLEIIKMDFDYIWNDGIKSDYPIEFDSLTIHSTTQKDGTLLDSFNSLYFGFKETNEI